MKKELSIEKTGQTSKIFSNEQTEQNNGMKQNTIKQHYLKTSDFHTNRKTYKYVTMTKILEESGW